MSDALSREEVEVMFCRVLGGDISHIPQLKAHVAALRTRLEEQTEKADAYQHCMYEEMDENVQLFELLGVHQTIKDGTAGTEAVTAAIKELLRRLDELATGNLEAQHRAAVENTRLHQQVADLTAKLAASDYAYKVADDIACKEKLRADQAEQQLAAVTQERDLQQSYYLSEQELTAGLREQLATVQAEAGRLQNIYRAAKVVIASRDVALIVTESVVDAETMQEQPTLVTQDYVNELWNQLVDAVNAHEQALTPPVTP